MSKRERDGKPRIALGISGSIAAYKSLVLARLMVEENLDVRPLLTRGARQFVTPLSLSVLTGHRAITNLWTASASKSEVNHVELAHAIDLFIIAPATADLLVRLANGEANDPVSSVALATRAPILIAPAMEPAMWSADTTRSAIEALKQRGWHIAPPTEGFLASGRSGIGRMAEPSDILASARCLLSHQDLRGRSIVVTAGPTRESIDPARFISNPSTGKMGVALARRAKERGARVTLIHGPLSIPIPDAIDDKIQIQTTQQLLDTCATQLEGTVDALIMAAAPADYRPKHRSSTKLKKRNLKSLELELEANPDILKTLEPLRQDIITVGFAAESDKLEHHARQKLTNKKLDLIVGNYIGKTDQGFGTDTNEVWIFDDASEPQHVPLGTKEEIADAILSRLAKTLESD